ncbi:MAG: hypothetical protein P4L31_08610 [Candidatus Babeliales bacterium]|nr:hypothetical protein [Candidatus Babeliales bacterium]
MISKKSLIIIAAFVALLRNAISFADTIGSDTAVSVESAYTFPTSVDNRIANFGFIKNGFTLQDSLTTCTFDSVFPVSGSVQLNAGTLYLNQDLIFSNITSLQGLGTIIADGHLIDFCSSVTSLLTNATVFQDAYLQLNGFVTVNSAITFQGNTIFDGGGNNLILEDNGSINVASGATLLLKNITIENVAGANINLADDTSKLVLHDVTWQLNNDFTFAQGSMHYIGTNLISGPHDFFYTTSQASSIAQNAQLTFTNGVNLILGNGLMQPLSFVDLSSILAFDNAALTVNANGVQFTKGTVATMRDVQIDVVSTSSSTGLILGDGTPEGDMIFQMHPGCSTRYVGGSVVYNITNGNGIQANTDTINLIRSDASIFWLNQNLQLTNLSLDVGDGSNLYVAPGKTLTYSNATMNALEGSFTLNGIRYNSYTTLLAGNQSIFMIKGYIPMYTLVSSTGNAIQGNGNIGGAIILQDSSAELIWGLEGKLLNTMYMNGGSLVLESNFACANGVQFSGPGIIHLGNNSFILGQNDLNWSDAIYWDGSDGVFNINSNVTLSNTWTFSGQCILDCGNHILDISSGSIVVEKGSHLTIRNVKIQNIAGNCIACLDDAASVVLDNVIWLQNGDYAFTHGSLTFRNDVIMRGSSIFAYQSNQVSTIAQHASLMFDDGFTFSYDPIDSTSSQLLQCINNESQICLNNATLYAAGPGLQLTKGKISIDGLCSFASEVTTQFGDPGITLGDCNAADDLVCVISGGSQLTITQGSLQYKNVNASSFTMLNNMALLSIGDNASLYLYQNLNAVGMTTFGNNVTLGESSEAQLLMGTSQMGILNNVTSPSC